jgi:hypothetical protein
MDTGIFDEFGNEITIDPTQTKPADVNFYQQKVAEFQQAVNAVDTAAYGLRMLLDLDITDDQRLPILQQLGELEEKKSQIRTAAETVNTTSALANSIGITLPKVNIQTLGALPLVPLAVAGAISAALFAIANLVTWITDWIARSNQTAQIIAAAADLPPEQKTRVLEAINATETAKAQVTTGLGSIANIVKYVAFAAVAFFAYQAFTKYQSK